jgi:hypothetical protein
VTQGFLVKTPAKLSSQLSPQRGDNSPAILCPLLFKDVLSNALPYPPVKQDQRGVHLPRHILPSLGN